MSSLSPDIEIISAPSILGLKPAGVEGLADSLLAAGLAQRLRSRFPVIRVPDRNHFYGDKRGPETNCLNAKPISDFSLALGKAVSDTINKKHFTLVLGGDCSILIGIMPALKAKGRYGLIFLDAHADFYEPEKSMTGEVADMDLAIITGRGTKILTNIHNLQPYVKDEDVIHIGQRDEDEAKRNGSQDIRETGIKCLGLAEIEEKGINWVTTEALNYIIKSEAEGFWIHYDTDVLSDEINPAVDYRLPGGLLFDQIEKLVSSLLLTGKVAGMSITVFNPKLDNTGLIAKNIAESLGRAFEGYRC